MWSRTKKHETNENTCSKNTNNKAITDKNIITMHFYNTSSNKQRHQLMVLQTDSQNIQSQLMWSSYSSLNAAKMIIKLVQTTRQIYKLQIAAKMLRI